MEGILFGAIVQFIESVVIATILVVYIGPMPVRSCLFGKENIVLCHSSLLEWQVFSRFLFAYWFIIFLTRWFASALPFFIM